MKKHGAYKKNLITIDPGVNGGICWTNRNGTVYVARSPGNDIYKMKVLFTHILRTVKLYKCRAIIEQQGPNPRDTSKTSFVLGGNYFLWRMCLEDRDIDAELLSAQHWQKKSGVYLPSGEKNYKARKDNLKAYSVYEFPLGTPALYWSKKQNDFTYRNAKITSATADAAAIMVVFGKKKR